MAVATILSGYTLISLKMYSIVMVSLPLISFHPVVSVTLQGEEEESTLDLLEVTGLSINWHGTLCELCR